MTSAVEKIANHLGMDKHDLAEYRYQPTHWSCPVFAIGEEYWAAGARAPVHTRYPNQMTWTAVVSSYDRKTRLWIARGD